MITRHLLIFIAIAVIVAAASVAGCATLTGNAPQSTSPGSNGVSQYSPGKSAGTGSYESPSLDGNTGSSSYYYPPVPSTAPDASSDISNRKVIMTAYIQIETKNFDQVVSQVRSMAPAAGGYVQSSSMNVYGDNRKTSTITLKVPQSKYEDTLKQIRALGTVKSDRSSGSDVTGTYVDLEARLNNAKSSEARLLDIMKNAKNVTEVLAVEQQLMRVQGDIESYTAQLRTLSNQVDFSTITVDIAEPQPVVAYDWGIGQAFTEAVHAFVGMIGGLIVLTGYLIPLAIYLVLAIAAIYLCIKGAIWLYNRSKQPRKIAEEKKP